MSSDRAAEIMTNRLAKRHGQRQEETQAWPKDSNGTGPSHMGGDKTEPSATLLSRQERLGYFDCFPRRHHSGATPCSSTCVARFVFSTGDSRTRSDGTLEQE